MASLAEVVEKVADEVRADVLTAVKAVKADERYAPLVAGLAEQVLSSVLGRSDVPAAPAEPANG